VKCLSRRYKFALQVSKSSPWNTWFISEKPSEQGQTVGILRGEFMTSREPLDLIVVQGRYAEYSQRVQSSGGAGS
jgi:hypothetical protein